MRSSILVLFLSIILILSQLLRVSVAENGDGETTTTTEFTTTIPESTTTTLEITTTEIPTTTSTTTTTTIPTCGISADNIIFGNVNPGGISSEKTVTIINTGYAETTSLTIKGYDWTPSMPVGQTHWDLTSVKDYDLITTLTVDDVSLGEQVGPGNSLPVYFKLKIPQGQAQGDYTQTITFTGGC